MFDSPLKDGLIVLVILLLFFGPKRLPALSRAIGESVREFKGGIGQGSSDSDTQSEIPAAPPAPAAAPPAPAPVAAPEPAPTPAAAAPEASTTAGSATEQHTGA